MCPRKKYLEIPFGCPVCHLSSSYQRHVQELKDGTRNEDERDWNAQRKLILT